MGAFRESIAKSVVQHATDSNLKWEQWHQEYLARRTDDIDDEIYKAGRWFHVRLGALRGEIDRLARTLGPRSPTLRVLVAVANRHMRSLTDLTDRGLATAAHAGSSMTVSQFHRIGLPAEALGGGTHTQVVTVAGDCIAGFYRTFASTPTGFGGFDIHAALPTVWQIFWAQFIAVQLEQCWQYCLWHGYRIEERGGESIIVAPDEALTKSVVAAEDRNDNHDVACVGFLADAWRCKRRRGPIVHGVTTGRLIGGYLEAELSSFADAEHPPESYGMRHSATAALPSRLLSAAPPRYDGLTIEELLSGFEALNSFARAFFERRIEFTGTSNSILDIDAPCVLKKCCIDLVAKACGFDKRKAAVIVNELTFGSENRDDAWSRPLVPADSSHIYIVHSVLLTTSPRRLIDHWLRTGGFDNEKKGAALEQIARDRLVDALNNNPILLDAHVHRSSCRFEGRGGPEIDALVRVGRNVLVCELKCVIHPVTAVELANFRKQVLKGIKQVREELAMAERHRTRVARDVEYRGDPTDLTFTPLVLVDTGVASGVKIDGVPVLDTSLLEEYLASGTLSFIFEIPGPADSALERSLYIMISMRLRPTSKFTSPHRRQNACASSGQKRSEFTHATGGLAPLSTSALRFQSIAPSQRCKPL